MRRMFWSFPLLAIFSVSIIGAEVESHSPVNPNATEEAVELLKFVYSISGEKTLAGQHDYPMSQGYFYRYARSITGRLPALMGRDLGFSDPDTLDGINFRQKNIDDLIEAHKNGTIVTLMWHAVPPTQTEPVTFKEGVQSKLSEKQWQQLLENGTELHERWKSQVDAIVPYLRQLQFAKVPVLWRPYHEMNGDWFWWCANPIGYQQLYRMLYNRIVNYHGIHNLLWVFNGNQVNGRVKPYAEFYPGHDYVDILATDVYRKYDETDYVQLLELGEGRPIALGEIGPFPTVEYLENHPKWVWYMSWSEFLLKPDRQQVIDVYHSDRVIDFKELQSLRAK